MNTVEIPRPAEGEHHEHYRTYVRLVPDGNLLDHLQSQAAETVTLLRGVSEDKSRQAYAPGKWNIREVMAHVTDTERVFAYRALSFARADANALPSFDENAWARASNATRRSLQDHIDDFIAVRAATLALFRGLSAEDFARTGVASGNPVSVRALAWIIAGHERHHVAILRDRYGI